MALSVSSTSRPIFECITKRVPQSHPPPEEGCLLVTLKPCDCEFPILVKGEFPNKPRRAETPFVMWATRRRKEKLNDGWVDYP